VGDDVSIEGPAFLHCLSERGVRIGSGTSFGRNLWLHCGGSPSEHVAGFVEIGEGSYIGPNGVVGAGGGVTIGRDVLVGPGVVFSSENHNFSDPSRPISQQGVTRETIVVDDNCWIGSRAVILAGVHIRSGVVVAAGAVVGQDMPANSIVAGVPARVIKPRCRPDDELD
jgi:acetyltransferase-like isoleucine patch superfamily enzyme